MIRRISVFLFALVVIVSGVNVVCQAESQAFMTHHTRDAVVNGIAPLLGHLPESQAIHFDVVLALRHQPELLNFLKDIYDPSSPNYRHYVTPAEFTERFGPSQEDFDAFLQFAKASGFTVTGGSRDSMDIQMDGTVGAVERAFHVQINLYQNPDEDRTFFAPDREPSADLPFQLWHITGLDNYSMPRALYVHGEKKASPLAQIGSCPEESFCGSDMRAAYYGGTALTGSGQNIGILEYLGEDVADVATYYKNAGQTEPYVPTLVSVDGYSTSCLAKNGCDDTEQSLDLTQAMGMAPGSTMSYEFICGNAATFSDTACLGAMSTASPLPLSLSSSWTWSPPDISSDDPYFEKMQSQGQSFFQAAGDSGVYRGSAPWPANSAYVITVGGTDLVTSSAGGPWKSETAWADGGGGYGTNVDIPSWQTAAVGACSSCNKTYRNVPDVAGNANFTFYVCADQTSCSANEIGGTSFAAPMWAGYLALVNQFAASNGNNPPGFINPTIYSLSVGDGDADFHDITSGSNGATCSSGYNECDGWGSPTAGATLITAIATGGGGGGAPGISFSPTSLAWGKILIGDTSGGKKVTVTNTGTEALTISSITISGNFNLMTVKATKTVTPCGTSITLNAGSTCVIKVNFQPQSVGSLAGDVTFNDNASGSPQQVALSGKGKD